MDVVMPQLGESVTEGTITKWFKAVGDSVALDEVLFEVSTDKVDSEVPSPVAGVLLEIVVPEGETVDVGGRIAVVGEAGAETPTASAPAPEPVPEPAPEPVAVPTPVPEPVVAPAPVPDPEPAAPDPDPAPAVSAAEAPTASAPASAAEAALEAPSSSGAGRILSPLVRALMRENSLSEHDVTGTGLGGRITRADVEAVLARRQAAPAPAPAPAPATVPAPATAPRESVAPPSSSPAAGGPAPQRSPVAAAATPPQDAGNDVETVPFSNIRRRTAEHMVRSKTVSAHAACVVEVDYSNVDHVRLAHKDAFKAAQGMSLTYLPFIALATVDALREFPHVNASVGDDALLVHREIHLGIAVDLSFEGLIAPVVHHADQLRLQAMAHSINDLATRARARGLGIDDISGGTFTLTNNGSFGSVLTLPIINQPQVAILSTDAVRKAPIAIELPSGEDAVVVRPVGRLVLAWDHRAFDGAYAGSFVSRVKEILETRDWSAEF